MNWTKKIDDLHLEWFKKKYGLQNFCYICGEYRPISRGHFRKRRFEYIRWNPRNVKPLCVECNVNETKDILDRYEFKLRDEYGDEAIDELYRLQSKKPDVFFYESEIERLKNENQKH